MIFGLLTGATLGCGVAVYWNWRTRRSERLQREAVCHALIDDIERIVEHGRRVERLAMQVGPEQSARWNALHSGMFEVMLEGPVRSGHVKLLPSAVELLEAMESEVELHGPQ